jgi:hypothetical protein
MVGGAQEAATLPTGAVTFLLTDIEGSVRGWGGDRERMATAVARHYELLDEAAACHRGVRPQEQGAGDSVVAAFARPSDALGAALDAQVTLTTEEMDLSVRMAIHTPARPSFGTQAITSGQPSSGPHACAPSRTAARSSSLRRPPTWSPTPCPPG